jgi:uncharacterized protein (TIGR02284 family)
MTVTDTLNSLLRGELAATETYQQALAKLRDSREAIELRRAHRDHRTAANELRKLVHDHAAQPDQDSGVWGTFAKLVEGTAKLFGPIAALKALKEGEEQGLSDYQAALSDGSLPADAESLVRATLLPQTQEHIRMLDRLMEELTKG